jgi:transcriptional regulator EpsA
LSTPDELDSLHLSPAEAQALLRMIEAAPEVRRRYQFFNWLQGQVHPLLRHHVALCGAYSRVRRQLLFEVFNSVPLSPGALQQLASPGSRLLQHLAQAWVQGEARPQVRALADVAQAAPGDELQALAAAGVQQLMVHGVSLPDRPHELVTLFVLAGDGPAPRDGGTHLGRLLELAVHPMHAALLRMLSFERELGAQPVRAAPGPAVPVVQRTPRVTAREAQILSWVREGMNNQQIGTELGISALTVKNHIQKILRKLGASNRAHAVALAMQWRLLNDDGPASGFGSLGSGA